MVTLGTILTLAEKSNVSVVEATKKVKNISEVGIKEVNNNQLESIKLTKDTVLSKLEDIKNLTPEQLQEKMANNIEHLNNIEKLENNSEVNDSDEGIKKGLKDEERIKIREESGWSDEIISSINSVEEYDIYKNAGLQEAEYDGKKCLIRNEIDWEQKDAMGRTNRERSEQGLSPINKEGKVIELHHIGQHADSPLAELTAQEHRGKGNDTILHNKTKESEINRQAFAGERSEHWEARANERSN